MRIVVLAALLAAWSWGGALAQGDLTQGYFVQVKNSSDLSAFEAALKAHNEWHASKGDSWVWLVATTLTGRLGGYLVMSGGHTWADFDNPAVPLDEDFAHWSNGAGRFVESESSMIWRDLPELGRPGPEGQPVTVVQVIDFELDPSGEEAVIAAAAAVKEAADAANFPGRWSWSRSVSHDGPPTLTVALLGENWAAFDTNDEEFMQMMAAHHGEEKTMELFAGFSAGAREISSQVWMVRLDLSHLPEGM